MMPVLPDMVAPEMMTAHHIMTQIKPQIMIYLEVSQA